MDVNFTRAPQEAHLHAWTPERPAAGSAPEPKPASRTLTQDFQVTDHTIRIPQKTQRILHAPAVTPETPADPVPEPPNEPQVTLQRWDQTEAIVRATPRSPSFVLEQVEIPSDVDARLVMLYGHASEQARAFRLLRHRLLAQADPRVIAVTSAEPEEGKTTCAANLALALADETMSRVLLVEANLRRPALGTVFGYEPTDSFVRRLVDHRDASTPYPVAGIIGTRLHVAALPLRPGRQMRLDRLLFGAALHELRAAYDYIVIDSAAVLESADADVAGECADGVLLVASAGVSRKKALAQATEQLRPTRILGTVILDT